MIISHAHRFVFLKTTKTGSTSVEVELARLCGPADVISPITPEVEGHAPRNAETVVADLRAAVGEGRDVALAPWVIEHLDDERAVHLIPHLGARTLRALYPQLWSDYLTFCVERNPWDKLVSQFHHRARSKYAQSREEADDLDFARSVGSGLTFLSNGEFWSDHDGTPIVDRILRYENLDAELAEVLGTVGIDWKGPIRASAKRGWRPANDDYRAYYDDETKAKVAVAQRLVIEQLGYEF